MSKRAFINGLLGLLWALAQLMTSHADPLDRWTWRYPKPQGNTLRAVTYGNGLFVAVGDNGTIISSGDGYNWTNQTFGKFPTLLGVGYSSGMFAAVGVSGTLLTSPNGIDWIQQASGTSNTLRGVAGNPTFPGNGFVRFVAVGDAGTALTSVDGTEWTKGSTGTGQRLNAATFSYGLILIVGDGGTFLLGSGSFSQIGDPGFSNNLFAIAENDYLSVAGGFTGGTYGTGVLLYSPDWFHWTNSGANAWCPKEWFKVSGLAYGTNRFVAVGYTAFTLEYNYPGIVLTSGTGTNWTGLPSHTSENYLYGVTFGNGLFVAVGAAGSILVSSNGVNWAEITGYHRTAITALACTESLCIASGKGAHRFYGDLRFDDFSTLVSSNGFDWIVSTTNLPAMNDLVGVGNLFVAVSGNCTYTTTNGFDWISNCISSNVLSGVGYGGGLFFAVGGSGGIYTSSDGSSWSNHSVATAGSFNCAAYGNGLYVAAGTVVATSSNGVSWSLYPTNPPMRLTHIVYGNSMFVAAGDIGLFNGSLLTSLDGVNWQIRYSSGGYSPTVAYCNGSFLAISSGTLLKSPDGINWTASPTFLPLLASGWFPYYPYGYSPTLCAHQRTFIVAGMDGILMQSDDTTIPILSRSTSMTQLGFSFSFPTQTGDPFRVQATTNFNIWDSIYGNTGSGEAATFLDPNARSTPLRFFRVVSP